MGRPVFGAILRKYETTYLAMIDTKKGTMTISSRLGEDTRKLVASRIAQVDMASGVRFEFANVDHLLTVKFGTESLSYDTGRDKGAAGQITDDGRSPVEIFGKGQVQLRHIKLFRDIHYISGHAKRAGARGPFELEEDEFFVCGDNSPDSFDSRMWQNKGKGNNSVTYKEGVVPSDYLVGKAVFVYWANASRPFETLLPIIPDLSQIRFIQGSSR